MKKIQTVILTASMLAMSGCATIFNGTTQNVKFVSQKPTKFTVAGKSYTTPATVALSRQSTAVSVVTESGKNVQVNPHSSSTGMLGYFFDGFMLNPFMTTTDMATGAGWEYDDTVSVD